MARTAIVAGVGPGLGGTLACKFTACGIVMDVAQEFGPEGVDVPIVDRLDTPRSDPALVWRPILTQRGNLALSVSDECSDRSGRNRGANRAGGNRVSSVSQSTSYTTHDSLVLFYYLTNF
jgi:hypothetical protein